MTVDKSSRRNFLGGGAAVVCGLVTPIVTNAQSSAHGQTLRKGVGKTSSYLELLRKPDVVTAYSGLEHAMFMKAAGNGWAFDDVVLETEVSQSKQGMEISLTSPRAKLSHLHLRWRLNVESGLRCLGDHWERSYGDLEWRGIVPDRVMPWYFMTFDGHALNGYGVKTQPGAFCFWQLDAEGVSLWTDIRNGGGPVELGQRTLNVATIVSYKGDAGEPTHVAAKKFCAKMSEHPRLPVDPLFGSNDWNYAYGANTADGILRDADLIAELATGSKHRPTSVIDDGWQDKKRFPSMPGLAEGIRKRGLRPGLWVRPLRAAKDTKKQLLLPAERFGKNEVSPAFDPTIPEALEIIKRTVQDPVDWGYEFIKHDFSTYELLGRWGFEMGGEITSPGWQFSDRSKTNAEIIADLYRSLRDAAGDKTIVLGCNTVGHLAAGLFESQRIGDDTSGTKWERTRRMGVNTLAFRMAQHKTFTYIDPDCVAITKDVDWSYTKQWLDVVSRSGTSLFVSPQPGEIGPEQKAALREAFALVVASSGFTEGWLDDTAPKQWRFDTGSGIDRKYDWSGNEGAFPFRV